MFAGENAKFYYVVVVAIVVAAAVVGLANFAPFAGDALAGNLPLAQLILRDGVFTRNADLPETYLPHNWETLLALSLALGGERAVSTVNVAAVLALLAILFFVMKRLAGGEAALLGGALFLLSPEMVNNFSQPKADAAASAAALAAIWCVLRYVKTPAPKYFFGASFLAGLAVGTKMSLFVSAAPVLIFSYYLWVTNEKRPGRVVLGLALSPGIILLLTAPWWFVNWRATGNPFFPYFHSAFGGEPWVPTMIFAKYSTAVLRRLTLPVYLALARFTNAAHISAAIPAFLLVGVFALWRKKGERLLLLLAGILYAGYFVFSGRQEGRYFMPLVGTFAAIAGYGAVYLISRGGWRRLLTYMVLALAVIPLSSDLYWLSLRIPAAVGLVSKGEFFNKEYDACLYYLGKYAAENLPPEATIASVWSRYSYYVPVKFVDYRSPTGYLLHAPITPAEAAAGLSAAGVDYILSLNAKPAEEHSVMNNPAFQKRLEPVYRNDRYTLYRLSDQREATRDD
jgi:hypothetical protein